MSPIFVLHVCKLCSSHFCIRILAPNARIPPFESTAEKEVYSPLECRKHCRCLGRVAHVAKADSVAQEHSQRNESRKPEQHGQRLGSQDTKLVCRSWEFPRGHDEVNEREQCPDRGEDEEVDLARGGGMPVVGPPVCDCEGFVSVMRFSVSVLSEGHTYHRL